MNREARASRHATVVAWLALFVAVGGTAWAVGAGSVGTKQLKRNAVTTPKVKNGSLLAKDLRPGQIGSGVIQGSTGDSLVTSQSSEEWFVPSGFTEVEQSPPVNLRWQISPNRTTVLRDLVGRLAQAPNSAGGRAFQLQNVDTSEILIWCLVVNAETTCDSGNATATLPPQTRYRVRLVTGNPAPGPSEGAAWAFRMVAP